MEWGIGCCCGGESVFSWGRPARYVGTYSPHASLSDYADEWAMYPSTTSSIAIYVYYVGEVFGVGQREHKMKPVRFEIGKTAEVRAKISTRSILTDELNAAISDYSPPTTGHITGTVVQSIGIPAMIFSSNAVGIAAKETTIDAIEIFRNGVSEELFIFETPEAFAVPRGSLHRAPVITLTLGSPVVSSQDDVWSWDVYCTARYRQNTGHIFGNFATGTLTDEFAVFNSTTTNISHRALRGNKFVFGSNGPGGATELRMITQSGWTLTETSETSLQMTNGTYTIYFVWGREIPIIGVLISGLTPPVAKSGHSGMRYFPADSGDYDSMYYTDLVSVNYGLWNPDATTLFETFPYSYVAGFPASVSIAPI